MWYVVQVRTGMEEAICAQCRKVIPETALEKVFLPYYIAAKKYHGEWHEEEKVLFPGYVFMITDDLNKLHIELGNVLGLTKLLGTGQDIIPLTDEEVDFLLAFGREEQCVEMSEGIIEQEKVRILKGPLAGMEGYIRKIDRHKRKAYLEIQMFGRTVEMQAGLEIVRKS